MRHAQSRFRHFSVLAVVLTLGACESDEGDPIDPEPETGSVSASVRHNDVPLEGVLVRLFEPGQHIPLGTATTGWSGQAGWGGLAPGNYDVSIIAPPGYSGSSRQGVEVIAAASASVTFEVAVIEAEPTTGTIHARVVEDSVGLPDISIELVRGGVERPLRYGLTDSNGWIYFPDVPVGDYQVRAALPEGYEMIPSYAVPTKHARSGPGYVTTVQFNIRNTVEGGATLQR